MEESIRVLIADDHPLFRDGMRGLLGSLPDMEVVGEASSGEQAIELAKQLQPDVMLMDIKMPGINGIEATREILHISPRIGVLVVTMFEDDDSVFAAMRAGARGYLLKDSSGQEVGHAIRAVASGDLRCWGCPAPHKLLQRPKQPCQVAARLPGAYRARRRDPLPGRPGQDQLADSQRAVCEPKDCS